MSKRWLLGATTAAMLIATPALAANDAAPGGDTAQIGSAAQEDNAARGANGADKALPEREAPEAASAETTEKAPAQRRLRQALKEAGFTDVQILGATYRIRAKDEDGNTFVLRVNPRGMDRHGKGDMHKYGMSNHGMSNRGMANDGDDMASDDMEWDDMDRVGMDRGGMHRDAMSGETAGEGGRAYGAGPAELRGERTGRDGRGRRAGGDLSAFGRAYDQGFRDGYSRGFNRAQGWR